jgi:hypothetical protein
VKRPKGEKDIELFKNVPLFPPIPLDGKLTCTECGKIYKDVKNGLEEKG